MRVSFVAVVIRPFFRPKECDFIHKFSRIGKKISRDEVQIDCNGWNCNPRFLCLGNALLLVLRAVRVRVPRNE